MGTVAELALIGALTQLYAALAACEDELPETVKAKLLPSLTLVNGILAAANKIEKKPAPKMAQSQSEFDAWRRAHDHSKGVTQ